MSDGYGPLATPLRRAVVLGSGVMGAQIAALLAGAGVRVDLLDRADAAAEDAVVRSRLARRALEQLPAMRPAPLYSPAALERIRPGNVEDDLDRVRRSDFVIEAVVEDLEVKRLLWRRVASLAGERTLLATNTSGLSIATIAQAIEGPARERFLGMHFFNPPRYLRLVELIAGPDTAAHAFDLARIWCERDLGKGVVVARDTPNFIANRVGGYALSATLAAAAQAGLGPEAVDALTGTVIGHPASATFRTLDMVGLDTALHVADNIASRVADGGEARAFAMPDYVRAMVARGLVGQKAGQGFYKRVEDGQGRRFLVVDPGTLAYREPAPVHMPLLDSARQASSLEARLRLLTTGDSAEARFLWTMFKRVLLYSAAIADEVAGGDLEAIDRAMRWGYGWRLGPFETWAALGLKEASERMAAEGERLPDAVLACLAQGRDRLYDGKADRAAPGPGAGAGGNAGRRVVWRSDSATLEDAGHEVAVLRLHPPRQAIGPDLVQALHRAARTAERDFRGLVLASRAPDRFLVGANLVLLLVLAQNGDFAGIEHSVEALQQVHLELKYLGRPVVAAVVGLALGGGAELALHADRIVSGRELYIGQVEAGVGLVPAGGGVKELLSRALAPLPPDLPWSPALAPSGPSASVGSAVFVDPAPFVARMFQTIALAKVSQSADEARQMGFLRAVDETPADPDRVEARAIATVLDLDALGYHAPDPLVVRAPGREVRALLDVAVDGLVRSGLASAHDARIARALAYVLCGGDVASGTTVSEAALLDLEREAFVRLCGEPLTQARMEHMLATGKPLRN